MDGTSPGNMPVRLSDADVERFARRAIERESRLRALGFEELSDEERRRNLALNVALMKWPS